MPGEERVRANSTKSAISTDNTPSGNTHIRAGDELPKKQIKAMGCLICKARVDLMRVWVNQRQKKSTTFVVLMVRESASSCKVSTGDDEAVFRTHIQNAKRFEWVDSDGVTSKQKRTPSRMSFCFGDPEYKKVEFFYLAI